MNEKLNSLIGIPWSRSAPPDGADCFSLALYAQEVLWGRQVDPWRYGDPSWSTDEEMLGKTLADLEAGLARFCDRADGPAEGIMATVSAFGYVHVVTFVDPFHVLHIAKGKTSQVSPFGSWFRSRVRAYWKIRDEEVVPGGSCGGRCADRRD